MLAPLLQGINSQAQLIECTLNVTPPEISSILSLRAFDLDRILEANTSFLQVYSISATVLPKQISAVTNP